MVAAQSPQHAMQPAASIFTRLNWKHYASLGALLVSLIALPIVLLSGAGRKTIDTTPTPPAQTQRDSSPAPSGVDSMAPTVPSNPPQQLPSGAEQLEPGTKSGPSTTSQRSARGQQREAAHTSTHIQPEPSRETATDQRSAPSQPHEPSQPPTSAQSPSGHDQQSSRADDSQKKNKGGKVGDATEAVGGAFKKLGGLFGGKKKDNKNNH